MDVDELTQKYLSRYKFLVDIPHKDKDKYPPWAIRKYIEMSNALMHPDLGKELFVLSLCSKESVWQIRQILQSYFSWSYKLTTETSYSIVMYYAGEDFNVLSPFSQLDGLIYLNEDEQGPKSDPIAHDITAISETLRDDVTNDNNYVNIRIGTSVQKTDVVWFVKKYWNDIEALIERPEIDSKQVRSRTKLLRNIREYDMRRNKVSTGERKSVHRINDDIVPDYDVLNAAFKQAKPNAKKNDHDLFSIVFEQIAQFPLFYIKQNTYKIAVDKISEAPYLYLENT